MSGTMDNGLGRRPLLALEPPHRILANVPQTGSISREHWDLPDQARKLVQISSSSGQAGRQVDTVGSGLRPLTDRKIRSKGLYFLILLVVRSVVVGVPVLFVRQLRQIFCVLIKHGLRRYLSPGPGPVGSGWAFAYSVPDLQPLPFCCQRICQWALPVVLLRTVPRNMPRIALRHNINVVTLRSIFPSWNDMQILTDIIFQYLCVKSVSAVPGEEGVEKSASRTTLIGKQTLCSCSARECQLSVTNSFFMYEKMLCISKGMGTFF